MLFFQCVLLAGYGYAHLLSTRLGPKAQLGVHVAVLALCALFLPVIPREFLQPAPDAEPISAILLLLGATVGLPYFALSSTGPLLQAWFARAVPGRSPWPLYALSNAGSLLALVSFPFLFEPTFGRAALAGLWSWAFGLFALLCAGVAWLAARRATATPATTPPGAAPGRRTVILWVLLPAVASALLLAFTHELCVDVASVPFLWVLPLSLYLLSFIVTFSGRKPLPRWAWFPLAAVALGGTAGVMAWHFKLVIHGIVIAYSVALAVLCIVLHGEVFRLRPQPARLTQFYLCVAAGGALGGLFVAVVAPLVFPLALELPLGLLACALALAACLWTDPQSAMHGGRLRGLWAVVGAGVAALAVGLVWTLAARHSQSVLLTRNFYGTYSVVETPAGENSPWERTLHSGTTLHGSQFLAPEYRHWPTTYYARAGGAGLVMESLPEGPRRVGVVGLGVGTLAAYGRAGDLMRFYEINPRCAEIARSHFYYLKDTPARIEIVPGDGRLSLEREPPQSYHLLVLDAFTSDSIPVHLLTIEAFAAYRRHLAPDGALCVHISNRHLDLEPVLRAARPELGLHMFCVTSRDDDNGGSGAVWVVLCHGRELEDRVRAAVAANAFDARGTQVTDMSRGAVARLWTDDYSNLFEVLR
jgi:hypothetical protein